MKTKTTVSRLEKTFNIKFDMDQNIPWAKVGNATIELYKNGSEKLAFVIVRREGDNDDIYSDYHGGTYCKTIKSAIESVNYFNKRAA